MWHTRLGALALGIAGVLFILYPAVRPWDDESTAAGAIAAMGSERWVASHFFAMLGFVLLPLGLLAVRRAVAGTRGHHPATAAVVTTWLGVGLTLPYFGAEDFGLHAVASAAADGDVADVLTLVDELRYGPVAVTSFALGLLALAAGAVLVAVAAARSGVLPRWSAVPFAVGFATFMPQFWTPAAVRIGHGVLLGIGLVLLAALAWRTEPTDGDAAEKPVRLARP